MAHLTEEVGTTSVAGDAKVFLQPIAAPSILGLFAFAGSTFVMAAWMVGWFGTAFTPYYLAPFIGIFGGIAQFFAGMWAYRARDGVATALHGTWGAFFLSYAFLNAMLFLRPGLRPAGLLFPELGAWFVVVAAISWVISLAAMGQRWSLAAVVMSVSAAATLTAIGLIGGLAWCAIAGGYLFMLSSLCALYDAGAHVMNEVYGHEVLKLGYTKRVLTEPKIMVGAGEPGVIHGQH